MSRPVGEMWRNEPNEDDDLPVAPDDQPEQAIDDDSEVELHGGWGGAARPEA